MLFDAARLNGSAGDKIVLAACSQSWWQCSQVTSKDVRAVRRDCATQEPTRALRITRLLFEILLLCLRRTRLERKSTKNRSKIDENPPQIDPKSTKNRSWAVLGAQRRFWDAFGRARDDFWTPKCRPKCDLGTGWAGQERPGAPQDRFKMSQVRSGHVSEASRNIR